MFDKLKGLLSKKTNRIGIYINKYRVQACKLDEGVLLDVDLLTVLNEIGEKEIDLKKENLWLKPELMTKLIHYCCMKINEDKFGLEVILCVPIELSEKEIDAIIQCSLEIVPKLKTIHIIENIIAAAIGTNMGNIKLFDENDFSKKIFIYGDDKETYIILLWAVNYVTYHKIEIGVNLLDNDALSKELEKFLSKIPQDVPEKYLEIAAMQPFLSSWNEDNSRTIYISVPNSARIRIGEMLNGFDLVYVYYNEHLVINGSKEVLRLLYVS